MIIKNFQKLASTPARKIALKIAEAGLEAIKTEKVLEKNVLLKEEVFGVQNKKFSLKNFKNIYLVAIGKAALESAKFLEKLLGGKIKEGIVVDIKKAQFKNLKSFKGTHPLPSIINLKAGKEILKLLKKAKKDDLIITVISGGGSALMCLPKKIKLKKLERLNRKLLLSGAPIQEINIVRKHLSLLKGGNFAKEAYPATVISLIFSDVPGDDLSFIASGPTVRDESTKADARRIAHQYKLGQDLNFFETPKEKKYFKNVHNFLLLSGKNLLLAMKEKATSLGFEVKIYSYALRGEARTVGRKILHRLEEKGVLLAVGETTVTVRGRGKGGRNQELVLGALPYIDKDVVLLSLASDGLDNTEAAGALGDGTSLSRARKMGLEWRVYLDNNDSFHFFEKLGDLIITGRTGVNVADLLIALKYK